MRDLDADIAINPGVAVVRERADMGEEALEAVYDRYASALFRYAFTLVGSAEDAEDAVQEVFVRIARERKRLRDIESIKAYLFVATRNAAFGILRSRRRRSTLQDAVCADFLTCRGERPCDGLPESTLVCQAFAELPTDQREVLVLKVFDEMTFKEIAETIGASANTVASRYRYALAKLRQALEEDNDG